MTGMTKARGMVINFSPVFAMTAWARIRIFSIGWWVA
jgi:hypothetical protein